MQEAHNRLSIALESYSAQQQRLPASGRHFIASTYLDTTNPSTSDIDSDVAADTVVCYQAYMPSIAEAAVKYQRLSASPQFKPARMTWIKPGFMWMMYRSGWATKPYQEHILAVHINLKWLMDTLRTHAILSVHNNAGKTKQHDVVVQWDPDHDYRGQKLERRAVQIGLRGNTAADYAAGVDGPAVVRIEDVTPHVTFLRESILGKLRHGGTVDKKRSAAMQQPGPDASSSSVHPAAGGSLESDQASDSQESILGELLVPVENVVMLDEDLQIVLA